MGLGFAGALRLGWGGISCWLERGVGHRTVNAGVCVVSGSFFWRR